MSGVDDRESFFLEARYQRVCAWCGRGGAFHAHHVVYKQDCVRAGVARYDTRNCLRLCDVPIVGCHNRQHQGQRVPIAKLTDENITFAVEAFGAGKAYNYLTRRYEGTDERVEALLQEEP